MDHPLSYPQSSPDFNVALALSLVLIGFDGKRLQLLLSKASRPPFEGGKMLPSRYISAKDDLMASARMMFKQMFGTDNPEVIEQLKAFSNVHRHPDGRVVNVAHYALVQMSDFQNDRWKEHELEWISLEAVPELVFDHNDIVEYACERLKRRVKRRPVGFNLLPPEFTLSQLQKLYEEALGKKFDRRNFRKKLSKSEVLLAVDKQADGTQRGQKSGAQLYTFNAEHYQVMMTKGYDFTF